LLEKLAVSVLNIERGLCCNASLNSSVQLDKVSKGFQISSTLSIIFWLYAHQRTSFDKW